MNETQDTSLRETFDRAKYNQQRLENLDPRSDDFQDHLEAAVSGLVRCLKLVKELSVFSPNEELEDISTQNLQFLTVDYLLADLLLKSYDENRLASLRRTLQLLESFLDRLDHYSMLSPSDRKLYERFQENRSNFSVLSTSNAEERRKVKVSRFQEEKQLKQKLEVITFFSACLRLTDSFASTFEVDQERATWMMRLSGIYISLRLPSTYTIPSSLLTCSHRRCPFCPRCNKLIRYAKPELPLTTGHARDPTDIPNVLMALQRWADLDRKADPSSALRESLFNLSRSSISAPN